MNRQIIKLFGFIVILFAILVGLTFIFYLFRVHRREWLGGPGPLELGPPPRPGGE